MIKTVIFDMDATIIDSMHIWKDIGSRYIRSLGLEPESGLDDLIFDMTIKEYIVYIMERYPISHTVKEVNAQIEALLIERYKTVDAKPGAQELLRKLKASGVFLVLATASAEALAKPVLSRLDMWDIFDKRFCALSKSCPETFTEIASACGCGADECCMVEDAAYSIENAKRAGLKTVGVCDPIGEKHSGSTRQFSDLYCETLSDTDKITKAIMNL